MSESRIIKFILGFIILLFVKVKWNSLYLPYFWDEAWSYIPAISKMSHQCPCLMPGCIDMDLYRGHPLLFYFLSALWMKFVSNSLFSMHLFGLIISVITLISFFRLMNLFLNGTWALFGTSILMLQEVFFVQSSFVLPEIMIMFLTIESLRNYVKCRRIYFLIYAGLLGIVKETGVLILLGFFLFHLLEEKKLTGKSIWIYLSLIPAIIFYGIQKIKFGWFFYPLHLGLIDDSFKSILAKFEIIIKFLFLNQGRGVLLFLVICSIIIYLYRSAILKSEEKKIIRLIGLIAIIFIIFSVFNFLMLRYLLFLFPLLILIACILFQNVARDKMMYYVGISFILFVGFMYSIAINYKSKEWHDDASINYLNMVKVHKEVVKYCENEDWFNKKIFTH